MEEKISFGKFIMKKRKEKNLTQRELAEQLHMTESAVSKWERGVSYPDITLVTQICEALGISERELITASDDFRQKELEQQAQQFQKLIKVLLWILNLSYGIALVTCFICNLAIDHKLSWFFIVLTAELTAFSLTSLPVLVKKNRGLTVLISFFVSLTLLLGVCSLYTGGGWFVISITAVLFGMVVVFLPFAIRAVKLPGRILRHKALVCCAVDTLLLAVLIVVSSIYTGNTNVLFTRWLPVAGVSVILPWLFLIAIRYLKINALFKTAICLVLTGIYTSICNPMLSAVIEGRAFRMMRYNFTDWSEPYINGNITLIVGAVCIAAAVIFAAGGIELLKRNKK